MSAEICEGIYVDRFSKGAKYYFLSHYHSDHTALLKKKWKNEKIYLSDISYRIAVEVDRIPEQNLTVISDGETCLLEMKNRTVKVTALDANHCPGALMFIFEFDGKKVVYTGDFRLNKGIVNNMELLKDANVMYLDNTYGNREGKFPSQEEAIEKILSIMRENINKDIYIGVYNIGKNKVLEEIYRNFSRKVFTGGRHYEICKAIGREEYVTLDSEETNIHAYNRNFLEYAKHRIPSDVTVIIPTGWYEGIKHKRKNYHYIPYSEHCDAEELETFVKLVSPKKIINLC